MNALVYHVASGQAFSSGIALLHVAVILAITSRHRVGSMIRTVCGCLGLLLIAVSATPLPIVLYAIAGAITLTWLGIERTLDRSFRRTRRALRVAVIGLCWLGLAFEIPYHWPVRVPWQSGTPIEVIGDSLSAGMGGEAETWPTILAKSHGVVVHDRSAAGATVSSAKGQADQVAENAALVIAEIGGNDVLAQNSTDAFERGLDDLLRRLRSKSRRVVLLELPLPPFSNRYGEIQRRLARKHRVRLVPKRVLLGVLSTEGATVDSIHLSQLGHHLMAETIWSLLERR